jgi:hypothetical protein
MNVNKWRIKRSAQYGWRWVIFAPGYALEADFVGNSFRQCVYELPCLMRIRAAHIRMGTVKQ